MTSGLFPIKWAQISNTKSEEGKILAKYTFLDLLDIKLICRGTSYYLRSLQIQSSRDRTCHVGKVFP